MSDNRTGNMETADINGTDNGSNVEEISITMAKGCVGDEFKGKDGKIYCEVMIPNEDQNDKRPWQTFVVRAANLRENRNGKSVWFKLPAEGSTTVQRNVRVGEDAQGKPIWDKEREKIPNRELKRITEAASAGITVPNAF